MTDRLTSGMEAYQAGNYAQATFLLGQLVEEDPSQVEAKLWLGASLVGQGEHDRAIFILKRVVKESLTGEVRAYAREMLVQLGVELPPEAESVEVPLRKLTPRPASFNNLIREICLLGDADAEQLIPWLKKYIQDVPQFTQELSTGFAGNEAVALVLEGLLAMDSPRRQNECRSRLQNFINAPNRVREQILGVFVRSVAPDNPEA
jgi:tetratricopeptide (TPR) repeat protein